MHRTIGPGLRLTALGAGVVAAAALAISASAPVLADTADTGGTAILSVPRAVIVGLAKSNVIVLPGGPAGGSYATGADAYTLPVTGGTGEVSTFSGIVDLGGSLVAINAKAAKTVQITGLQLNFFTGAVTGILSGATRIALGYLGGSLSESSDPGPPATETLSADEVDLSAKAATALNTALKTTAFARGTDLGAFTTTFDVTVG